jgi:hypothetical protein
MGNGKQSGSTLLKFNLKTIIIFSIILSVYSKTVYGWGNGGYSNDPNNPRYGTHDWIAQHALDWLPENEKSLILDNIALYLYGTELPDNGQVPDGVGDTSKHHVYYRSDGSLQDDAAALRAQEEFEKAQSLHLAGDVSGAVKRLGAMTHYISDVAVFPHVMGASTDWSEEKHHSDYEKYVGQKTSSYEAEFNVFLRFDGSLDLISAYNATLMLAFDTTFDPDGDLSCVWMDNNYDWDNPVFKNRCGESLNLAVNLIADVLHTFYVSISSKPSVSTIVFSASGLGEDVSGPVLIVDGTQYFYNDLPKKFVWGLGSTHSFQWVDTLYAGTGKQYSLTSVTGVSTSPRGLIKVLEEACYVNATYAVKYYLKMEADPSDAGSVSPLSGWYEEGSLVEISASPNPGYEFMGWRGSGLGSYTGKDNPVSITVVATIVETALFEKSSSNIDELVWSNALFIIVLVIMLAIVILWKKIYS